MGYRSDVVFWVHKSAVGRLLAISNTIPEAFNLLFKWAEIKTDKNGNMLFHIEHVKWYDAYSGVEAIEGFMGDLEIEDRDDEFGFHRLGEEFGDHENRGASELYEVYPEQHLACHGFE